MVTHKDAVHKEVLLVMTNLNQSTEMSGKDKKIITMPCEAPNLLWEIWKL